MGYREVLSITGAIDPRDLTPRLREMRLAALKHEAADARAREEQARLAIYVASRDRRKLLDMIDRILRGELK